MASVSALLSRPPAYDTVAELFKLRGFPCPAPISISSCNDLAELIENHKDDFARDQTFDARARIEAARNLAAELQAGVSAERLATTREQARSIRDRAYTYLDDLVTMVREAGRYAYRDDTEMRGKFSSEYLRRRRRRIASSTQPNPPETSFSEPTT